jgi:hypothetical protein
MTIATRVQTSDHLTEAARLIRLLADRVPAHREAAEAWLANNTRHLTQARPAQIVFDPYHAADYVWVGDAGAPRAVPHPGLAGIEDAHVILQAGAKVQHTHGADAFGCRPNALRNRLEAAARWAEGEGLPQLARCIGAIRVGLGGSLKFTQPHDVDLQLRMPT